MFDKYNLKDSAIFSNTTVNLSYIQVILSSSFVMWGTIPIKSLNCFSIKLKSKLLSTL